jgi:hypothetical protein
VDVGAGTFERRQKANAVLIRFLSWTRLLGASVSREKMRRNRNSVKSRIVELKGWVEPQSNGWAVIVGVLLGIAGKTAAPSL